MFNSKHKKMMELIKRKKDTGVRLSVEEMAYEIGIPSMEAERKKLQEQVQIGILIICYLISFMLSRSIPIISAILGTVTLFVGLILFNLVDGKIDLNRIYKEKSYWGDVFMVVVIFFPLYSLIYLGFQDQKFELFLLKNECKYVQIYSSETESEIEYYCSKPQDSIRRSIYDGVQSNGGFNSKWEK
jgi:hypothetical protein